MVFTCQIVCIINEYSYLCSTRTRQASQRCSNVRVVFVFIFIGIWQHRMMQKCVTDSCVSVLCKGLSPNWIFLPFSCEANHEDRNGRICSKQILYLIFDGVV